MRPLENVDVLEFSQFVAGPNCGQWLATLGANVVKLEPPEGEPARDWVFHQFASYNLGGKKSVTIDLTMAEGREVAQDLAQEADVILQNYSPGTLERFGLDYDSVVETNEDVIYCSISAFGEGGPYSGYSGIDVLMQPMSGLMAYVGSREGYPNVFEGAEYTLGTNLIIDNTTGVIGALLIASMLRRRDHTGEGEHINVSLFDTAVQLVGTWIAQYTAGEDLPRLTKADQERPPPSPFGVFEAGGGELIYVNPTDDRMFERFCGVLDREDWLEDDRFEDREGRREHGEVLRGAVQEEVKRYDRDDLFHSLAEAGVIVGPYQDVGDVVDSDPHVQARDMLTDTIDVRTDSEIKTAMIPFRAEGYTPTFDAPPEKPGQNNREILEELGYSEEEIEELANAGVLASDSD